jgi:hypothetical protein
LALLFFAGVSRASTIPATGSGLFALDNSGLLLSAGLLGARHGSVKCNTAANPGTRVTRRF